MMYLQRLVLALLAGAITGALILGLVGRAAMAGVARISGDPANVSMLGVLQVVVVGVLLGAAGGVLLLAIRNPRGGIQVGRGATAGGILFLATLLMAVLRGRIVFEASSVQFFTLVVVAVMFLVFGMCADAVLSRWMGRVEREGVGDLDT